MDDLKGFMNFLDQSLYRFSDGTIRPHVFNINYKAAMCLKQLYSKIYVPISEKFPGILVTSSYRDVFYNNEVHGSPSSSHLYGEAMDFTHANMPAIFDFVKENLEFDQLIWEGGTSKCPSWLHVSYSIREGNRKQIIKKIQK